MGFKDTVTRFFSQGSSSIQQEQGVTPTSEESVLAKSQAAQESKSIIEDPLALISSLGYKDKPDSLTFETLRNMANKNSVISSIITTRVNQVSTFSKPARYTRDGVGFEISLRDPKGTPTDNQNAVMLAMETFLENCGWNYDPGRDDFDSFLRQIVRDSLTYDQVTFEVIPDRLGRPAEIVTVDASSIRAAAVEPKEGHHYVTNDDYSRAKTKWVQVYQGQIVGEFDGSTLAFAVRNPRTDINIQPYGFSELEVLIKQVTSHLWAEEYNSKYFSQGGTTKGILNLKGQNISKDQLDAFRRQWTAQLTGMTGAWKTPVVSVDGLEYINVSQSNREMEYEMWMNYLINICCAVYQIDPAEINFPNRGGSGGGSGGGLGDGGIEDRLKNSKDKGLRPILRFLESVINKYIVRRFGAEYSFNFVGLDKESEQEKLAVLDKSVRSYRTINEIRKEKDLPPLEKGGDVVLDPTFTNYLLQLEAQEQAEQAPTNDGEVSDDPEEAQQQQQDQQIQDSIGDQYSSGDSN
jgi:hypothetical protein